ncbi:helix-turn-helix transcriptional regulator [Aeromonas caviae]
MQASPLLAGLFARLSELAEEEVKGAYLTVLGQELERADPLAARIPLAGALDPRLLRVLDRVCQAPAIHLTLTALAADCGASVRTLNRLFLQQLGCSFRQWREQVVLGRARQLQHRGLTLAQIADRLGYEDPGALSRALQRLARREPAA